MRECLYWLHPWGWSLWPCYARGGPCPLVNRSCIQASPYWFWNKGIRSAQLWTFRSWLDSNGFSFWPTEYVRSISSGWRGTHRSIGLTARICASGRAWKVWYSLWCEAWRLWILVVRFQIVSVHTRSYSYVKKQIKIIHNYMLHIIYIYISFTKHVGSVGHAYKYVVVCIYIYLYIWDFLHDSLKHNTGECDDRHWIEWYWYVSSWAHLQANGLTQVQLRVFYLDCKWDYTI